MDRLEEKMSIAARASRDARTTRAPILRTSLEGSELFHKYIASAEGIFSGLQRQVWSGTPWMVDTWTGRCSDARDRDILNWCYDHIGAEAYPFGSNPRPGRWKRGGATVFGWTWFGFSTENEMRKFAEAWPAPPAENSAPDDTGSERSEHRDVQTNTSLHPEEKEETR